MKWSDAAHRDLNVAAREFVAGLGFSQLLFAWAADDVKSRNWLDGHRRMYAFYGGVPHVTVPDRLKQGMFIRGTKCSSKGWSRS